MTDVPPAAAPPRSAAGWVAWPFWNVPERRPRALWRIVGALMLLALVMKGALLLGLSMNGLGVRATLVRTATALVAIVIATWVLDRRRLTHLGLAVDRRWLADFAFGGALGVALIGLGVALLSPVGWMDPDIVPRPDLRGVAVVAVTLLLASFWEEILFRSWLLRVIAEGARGLGPRAALWIGTAVSSALFALLHGQNPNITALALLNIAAAGVFLALPYIWTGRLGLSWGLHWTWNLALGPLFGIPVSGIVVPSLVITRETGPDTITGGPFGFEGGLIALLLIAVAIAAMAAWVRRRRGTLAPETGLLEPAGPA